MEQLEVLKSYLREKEKLAVAFSGGVDSTFLLKVAHDVLGDNVIAVTVKSRSFPERECRESEAFCKAEGIRQIVIHVDELEIEGFAQNPPNRCYICKTQLFGKIMETAKEQGMSYVAEASNLDDDGDYRPGMQAVEELGALSPLRVAGFDKKTIRKVSKELGLLTWDKPSYACLSTRFVYGEEITAEKLQMIEQVEQFLIDAGFAQMRVRIHGDIARIEIEQKDFAKMFEDSFHLRVNERFKEIGFSYVSLDLGGYRTGSMNDKLVKS